jgi:hypothetical protein
MRPTIRSLVTSRLVVGTLFCVAAVAAGCSSTSVPIGADGTNNSDLNAIDAGTGLCGASPCNTGELCCAGADEYCSPTCMAVPTCPVYGKPCAVADSGTTTGDAGATDTGPATDAGDCCPATFDLYSCTFPDGGAGQACHNPAMGCSSSTTCGEGCDPVVTGRCGGPTLTWYTTCGDPVCPAADGGNEDAGVCAPVGSACTTKGQMCGTPTSQNCGAVEICDDHDPKAMGCPISSRKFKDDIEYLDDASLAKLHDETLGMHLATYNYKSQFADPNPKHLGFIIEDDPQSLAVDRGHDRVDMYGYLSMIVATMQVQEKEIAALRSELEATRHAGSSKAPPRK